MLAENWLQIQLTIYGYYCFLLFQVRETVRDVVFLHNELFFAAAQKR